MVNWIQGVGLAFLGFMAVGVMYPIPEGPGISAMGFFLGVFFIAMGSGRHDEPRRVRRRPVIDPPQTWRPLQASPPRKRRQEGELEEWP